MLRDLFRLQSDMLTARGELIASIGSSWLLDRLAPNGGGNRPVVTLPGFLASGRTLLRLNRFLGRHGFEAQSWGLGRNVGAKGGDWGRELDEFGLVMRDTIRELADKHAAPVSLIGQSLGGVYARELALRMPDEIDRVIMLGSPTFHPYLKGHHNRIISQFGYWVTRQSHAEIAGRSGLLHWDADQPPLPCIAVHSPADGVVDEASSVIPQYIVDQSAHATPRENLGVLSSHIGMSVSPTVLLAIADRLVQDRDNWEPFNPYQYFPTRLHWAVSVLYPPRADHASAPDITALAESG